MSKKTNKTLKEVSKRQSKFELIQTDNLTMIVKNTMDYCDLGQQAMTPQEIVETLNQQHDRIENMMQKTSELKLALDGLYKNAAVM